LSVCVVTFPPSGEASSTFPSLFLVPMFTFDVDCGREII
jgi:hypothetical protein